MTSRKDPKTRLSPGTAGIAQRLSQRQKPQPALRVVRPVPVDSCTINQY